MSLPPLCTHTNVGNVLCSVSVFSLFLSLSLSFPPVLENTDKQTQIPLLQTTNTNKKEKKTQATLSPFGHVTKHLRPITSHLLPLFLCMPLSHTVRMGVLSQSREEKLGRKREKRRCWTSERKKKRGKVFGAKNKSRLSSSHSLLLLTFTTLDVACRCRPAPVRVGGDLGVRWRPANAKI